MRYKILLIEDDYSIVEMVQNYLIKEGFSVTTALDGEEGITKFVNDTYNLIVLDIMMPKLDGLEVVKIIRETNSVPILIISAKDSDIDKALGLGFGADDYIAKPFSLVEFLARVKAAIRRATKYSNQVYTTLAETSNVITWGTLEIDLDNFSVTKNQKDIKLTSKEFDILKLFVTNPNRVFTKAQIYGFIWNDDYYKDDNVINVHIRRLREKIEDQPSNPQYLKTLWGIGYKWGGS
ncbi:PhoP family transcriptional regulator [Aneurinibacillus migulanus]|uniref:response regulator transcription factor n=1 Tax=Aneurinibacillus migulanus TaxID=47500 RepID=UPI0006B50649|nr:response regulator transcription factor [Aneurinibacillus migulanus]KPD10054.1 PhoP family transcriptional regulator [Aneurinibacillus migulanus]